LLKKVAHRHSGIISFHLKKKFIKIIHLLVSHNRLLLANISL